MASLREIREGVLEEGVNGIFKGRTGQVQNGLLTRMGGQNLNREREGGH